MKDEYIIINKTAIQKRIEELEQIEQELIKNGHKFAVTRGKIDELISLLSQSTPLIPEIEKAFDAGSNWGEDCANSKIGVGEDYLNKQDYISNLKLDI